MISLLANGCPVQAIVAAFDLDERTVADWQKAAARHCQVVHEATIQQGSLDLQQVQANEIRVKAQGAILWLALAIAVSTRLWLGGVVSQQRDGQMALSLALQVKACALCRPMLICFDGFVSYLNAFRLAFRSPLRTGRVGRPQLIAWSDIALGRVVKQYAKRRTVGIERRLVQSKSSLVQHLLTTSQNGGVLNVAYIERLNATVGDGKSVGGVVRRRRSKRWHRRCFSFPLFRAGDLDHFRQIAFYGIDNRPCNTKKMRF